MEEALEQPKPSGPSIPDKLYFRIGEVCEIVGVEPHVLRFWETEFPMLAPHKSSSGQRNFRRKDVEVALRIKQLLREEGFTIAGARKRLQSEMRSGARLKIVTPEMTQSLAERTQPSRLEVLSPEMRKTIRKIKRELEGLLTLLKDDAIKPKSK